MEPELIPHAPDGEGRAVSAALAEAAVDFEALDAAYACAWRVAGLRESVGREPGDVPGFGPEPSQL